MEFDILHDEDVFTQSKSRSTRQTALRGKQGLVQRSAFSKVDPNASGLGQVGGKKQKGRRKRDGLKSRSTQKSEAKPMSAVAAAGLEVELMHKDDFERDPCQAILDKEISELKRLAKMHKGPDFTYQHRDAAYFAKRSADAAAMPALDFGSASDLAFDLPMEAEMDCSSLDFMSMF